MNNRGHQLLLWHQPEKGWGGGREERRLTMVKNIGRLISPSWLSTFGINNRIIGNSTRMNQEWGTKNIDQHPDITPSGRNVAVGEIAEYWRTLDYSPFHLLTRSQQLVSFSDLHFLFLFFSVYLFVCYYFFLLLLHPITEICIEQSWFAITNCTVHRIE